MSDAVIDRSNPWAARRAVGVQLSSRTDDGWGAAPMSWAVTEPTQKPSTFFVHVVDKLRLCDSHEQQVVGFLSATASRARVVLRDGALLQKVSADASGLADWVNSVSAYDALLDDAPQFFHFEVHDVDFDVLKLAAGAPAVPSWIVAASKGPDVELSDDELGNLFDGIWDLLEEENYAELDVALESADIQNMPLVAILGLLRYSFEGRHKLRNWSGALSAARLALSARSLNPDDLLAGLDAD